MNLEGYRKPVDAMIGRESMTEKLYRLEHTRNEAVKACAREWAKLTNTTEADFWKVSLPQALYDLLNSFDTSAAYIAAKALVEHHERDCSAI